MTTKVPVIRPVPKDIYKTTPSPKAPGSLWKSGGVGGGGCKRQRIRELAVSLSIRMVRNYTHKVSAAGLPTHDLNKDNNDEQ